jgi:hypothetical protein
MRALGVPVSSEHLARILAREVTVSSLLAYLAELDPSPFLQVLALSPSKPGFAVEASLGGAGRIDLLVDDGGAPVALVEVKVGASEHGQQLKAYEAWAEAHAASCHLITMDEFCSLGSASWGHHLLPEVLKLWSSSSNEVARVLAGAMAVALDQVLAESGGMLGSASRTAIAIAFRRLAYQVMSDFPELTGGSERTSGGQPSLVVYQRHPVSNASSEYLCVDLRSEARPAIRWPLRLGVEVVSGASAQALVRDQVRAHELAMILRNDLRTSRLARHLRGVGRDDLADVLSGGKRDGLRAGSDRAAADWLHAAHSQGLRKRQRHLIFATDRGRRITSVTHVEFGQLSRAQLTDLVRESLTYLDAAAR